MYAGDPNMTLKCASSSNLLIAVWDWGKYLGDQSLRLSISPYQRPNPEAVPIEAKVSGHHVNSIIASSEAKGRGFDEALLLDMNGYVSSGAEARRTIERGTTPNYRQELDAELKEVRESELWATGATVRQLRSKAAEKVEAVG